MKKYEISEEDIYYVLSHGRYDKEKVLNFLKSKPKIKYLSREEVEKILNDLIPMVSSFGIGINKQIYIDKICSLAIPDFDSYTPMPPNKSYGVNLIVDKIERGKPSICDEIENVAIKGEVVAEGKVTMPWENVIRYPKISIEKVQKYVGKNIEIYIKEV